MGASRTRWTGWDGWARDAAFAAALGAVLGLIGPFGTFVQAGVGVRLVYWIGLSLAMTPIYGLAIRGAAALDGWRGLPGAVWMIALAIAAAAPVALISSVVATRVWPYLSAMPPTGWLAQAMAVSLVIVTPYGLLSRRLAPFRPASAPPAPAVAPPSLKGRRDLICLQMEDHYVRVHTLAGSELVYLSMRDAEQSLDPKLGRRVHRSWWVAREAVVEPLTDGRNLRLRLINGIEAPVSRSQVAVLREAGWLGEGR
jgi:hypothetical protein